MKLSLFLTLVIAGTMGHYTYPGAGSPYGQQQGLFIPQVSEIKNISSANDVIYTRFCKAVCMLYVPESKTCGLNNEVYLNDCQARCDRVGTDAARLMFNSKCCCTPGTEYIDSSWVLGDGDSNAVGVRSASFCVSTTATTTTNINGKINVFAIPPCLQTCLGIDGLSDLKFVDQTKTFTVECDDGRA